LNIGKVNEEGEQSGFAKVTFGGAKEIRTVIFTGDFKLVSQGLRSQPLRFQLF
jgi:hypothetical protein